MCGDIDGAGHGLDPNPVTDSDCGPGYIYNTESHGRPCVGLNECQVGWSTALDQALCCTFTQTPTSAPSMTPTTLAPTQLGIWDCAVAGFNAPIQMSHCGCHSGHCGSHSDILECHADYPHDTGFGAYSLDVQTGLYTSLFTMQIGSAHELTNADACAFNPVDSRAYCTASDSAGSYFIIRFGNGSPAYQYVARIADEGIAGSFSDFGVYTFADKSGSTLRQCPTLHTMIGYFSRFDGNLADLTSLGEIPTGGMTEIGDCVTVSGNLQGQGAGDYILFLGGAMSPTVYAFKIDSGVTHKWVLEAELAHPTESWSAERKYWDAAWKFGSGIFFAERSSGGIYQLIESTVDLQRLTVGLQHVGFASAGNYTSDGMNCIVGSAEAGFATCAHPTLTTDADCPLGWLYVPSWADHVCATNGTSVGCRPGSRDRDSCCSLTEAPTTAPSNSPTAAPTHTWCKVADMILPHGAALGAGCINVSSVPEGTSCAVDKPVNNCPSQTCVAGAWSGGQTASKCTAWSCQYDDLILPRGTFHNESTGEGCHPGGTIANGTGCKFVKKGMFNACGRSICVNTIWRLGFINTDCVPCIPKLDPVPPLRQYEDALLFPLLVHPVIDQEKSLPNCSLEATDIMVFHSNEAIGGVFVPDRQTGLLEPEGARREEGAKLFPSHHTIWPLTTDNTSATVQTIQFFQWLRQFPEWPQWQALYSPLIPDGKKFGILALEVGKDLIGRSNVTIGVRTPLGVLHKETYVEIIPVNDAPTINEVQGTEDGETLTQLPPGELFTLDLGGLGPGGGADEAPQTLTVKLNNTNESVVNATLEYTAILGSLRRNGRRYDTLTHTASIVFETKCTGEAWMTVDLCDADTLGADSTSSTELLCSVIEFPVVVQPVDGDALCRKVGWENVVPPPPPDTVPSLPPASDSYWIALWIVLLVAVILLCCCCLFFIWLLFCKKPQHQLFVIGNPVLNMLVTLEEDYLEKWSVQPAKSVLSKPEHIGLFEDLTETKEVEYIAAGSTQISARVAQAILHTRHAVAFAGCVGDDKLGKTSQETSEASGMEVCFMVHEESTTNRCAVIDVPGIEEVTSVSELSSAANYTIHDEHIEMIRKHAAEAQVVYSAGFFQALSPETIVLIADETGADDRLFCINLSDPVLMTGHFFESMLRIFPYTDVVIGSEIHYYTLCDAMCALDDPQGFDPDLQLTEIASLVSKMHKVHAKRDRMVMIVQNEFESNTIIACGDETSSYPGIFCHDFVHRPESLPFDDSQCPRIVSANGVADAFVGGFLAKLCLTQSRWHLKTDWDTELRSKVKQVESSIIPGAKEKNDRKDAKHHAADGSDQSDEKCLPEVLCDAANHAAYVVRTGCFLNDDGEEDYSEFSETEHSDDEMKLEDRDHKHLEEFDSIDSKDILYPQRQARYMFEEESVEYEEHGVLNQRDFNALRASIASAAIPTQRDLELMDVYELSANDRDHRHRVSIDDVQVAGDWYSDQI